MDKAQFLRTVFLTAMVLLLPFLAQPQDSTEAASFTDSASRIQANTAPALSSGGNAILNEEQPPVDPKLPDEFKGWKISDWASVIQTLLALVLALSTFVLWRQSTKQIQAGNRMMQANYTSSAFRNFREIYLEYIKDEDQVKLLEEALGKTAAQIKKDYSATFLINHAYELFVYNKLQLIPQELWETIETDMRDLFSWPFVRERWHNVRNLYPGEYGTFLATKLGVFQPKPSTTMKRTFTVVHSTADVHGGGAQCGGGSCPTIYKTSTGEYVVQGYMLSKEEKASLNIPEGEEVIQVPEAFLDAFRKDKA